MNLTYRNILLPALLIGSTLFASSAFADNCRGPASSPVAIPLGELVANTLDALNDKSKLHCGREMQVEFEKAYWPKCRNLKGKTVLHAVFNRKQCKFIGFETPAQTVYKREDVCTPNDVKLNGSLFLKSGDEESFSIVAQPCTL